MATIINSDINQHLFQDFHPTVTQAENDYNFAIPDIKNDEGHMSNELSSTISTFLPDTSI